MVLFTNIGSPTGSRLGKPVDLALVIKSRLEELGLEQKDLAASAQVTESYISQLLARKKVPPSAARTEIYARMSRFLKLPGGRALEVSGSPAARKGEED
jgi:hypothetical protein